MISCIQELADVPTIIVLYYPGSSGEFFAHALSDSMRDISRYKFYWENHNRAKFDDLYGRSLTGGSPFDDKLLCDRANLYLDNLSKAGSVHLALAHPSQLWFVKRHFAHHPVIEITSHAPVSQRFRQLARSRKVDFFKLDVSGFDRLPSKHSYVFDRHLQIEWTDLMFDSGSVFDQLQAFLNMPGSRQAFQDHVTHYLELNSDIIAACYET